MDHPDRSRESLDPSPSVHRSPVEHLCSSFQHLFSASLLLAVLTVLPMLVSMYVESDAQEQKFDQVVEIGVKPGQMMYDIEEFNVPAGGNIKLIFDNTDGVLQHNVVIFVQGNERMAIKLAQKAWSMPNPVQNDYVPDSEKVLYATSLLNPGEKEIITFDAPDKPGDYPYVCTFPGHAMTMNGMMHVTEAADSTGEKKDQKKAPEKMSLSDLSYTYYEGNWSQFPDFSSIKAVKQGTLSNGRLSLDTRETDDGYGFLFEGTFHAPASGTYHFVQIADGDVRFALNEESVDRSVDADGTRVKMKSVKLDSGTHSYRFEYLQSNGGSVLKQIIIAPDGTVYPRYDE
jgi:azurin